MEPTSEQELKQLLEEGKITEEDYRQLLEAIHQKDKPQRAIEKPIKPRTGFGKAALILMIAGFLLSLVSLALNIILATQAKHEVQPRMNILFFPFALIGFVCLFLAFIFGIIGWKTTAGKIATIGVPCLAIFTPFLVGFFMGALFFVRAAVEYKPEENLVSHKHYLLDSLEGVLTQDGVSFDEQISSDGKGSLRIQTNSPDKTVVRLFETGPMGIDNRMLIYSAKLHGGGQNVKGYLEMWCDIPGKGEFFSRGIEYPINYTTAWATPQTSFRLEAGQMPANVKLNLVIEGAGTVWIDDIKLLLSPL